MSASWIKPEPKEAEKALMATPREVAEWMLAELNRKQRLYQETVVYNIKSKFGQEFVYTNVNGNLAIDRQVLKEFRAVTGDDVVWDQTEFMWRKRKGHDKPGRRMVD